MAAQYSNQPTVAGPGYNVPTAPVMPATPLDESYAKLHAFVGDLLATVTGLEQRLSRHVNNGPRAVAAHKEEPQPPMSANRQSIEDAAKGIGEAILRLRTLHELLD